MNIAAEALLKLAEAPGDGAELLSAAAETISAQIARIARIGELFFIMLSSIIGQEPKGTRSIQAELSSIKQKAR
jgi:hypothetical protein